MEDKFKTFLEIAKKLNEHGIIPTLYGSLGVYRLIGELNAINDIDIVIPNKILIDQFDELSAAISEIGYKQDIHYQHEFTKGNGQIGFEPESDLQKIGIDTEELKVTAMGEVKFKELSQKDYLVVYNSYLKVYENKADSIKLKISKLEELER
jgi:hypothetical protein